jgi:3-hydroxyacyl-CoA dehydrogenase
MRPGTHDHPITSNPKEERALRNVRLLAERNRQDPGLDAPGVAPQPVRSVGIVGVGTMGAEIAAAHVQHGVPVTIHDVDRRVLATAQRRIAGILAFHMPPSDAERRVARLVRPMISLPPAARCDLVLEAIVETFGAKRKLYAELEQHMLPGAVLASNTSTIPVGRLAADLADPSRFCGLHFCHPACERPLVEVIRGPKSSDSTIATAVAHTKAIAHMPVVVQDGPGFLVNRLLLPYVAEAMELLLEGASIEAVEQAANAFGWEKGPLKLLDEIGLDTALQGGWILAEAFPDRVIASPLLVAMIKAGRLGQKSGAGFFTYRSPAETSGPHAHATGGQTDDSAAVVGRAIGQWRRPPQPHTCHSITMRLMLPMVLEATRVLNDNKVRDPRDVDLAVIFGLGFPASRGGLLWWADTLGAARIIEMLRPLERLGTRVCPTPMLRELARHAGHFYRAT